MSLWRLPSKSAAGTLTGTEGPAAAVLADRDLAPASLVDAKSTTSVAQTVATRPTPGAAPDMVIWIESPAVGSHHSIE